MEAMAGQMGLDGRHCLLKVRLRQHLELDEGYLIHRGDDAGTAGRAHGAGWVQPSSGL